MAKRKKNKGLNIAIVVLNLLIVGIIIVMCILIYIYMTKETDNGRVEQTTTAETKATTTTFQTTTTTTTTTVSMTKISTTPPETVVIETEPVATTVNIGGDDSSPVLQTTVDTSYFSDDLFIGDSISTGLTAYGYLAAKNVFAQVGLNPESALSKEVDGYTVSTKVSEIQPKHTYIMLGSNGIGFLDGSYMVEEMKKLVAIIEEACPTTQIVIISIPPVTQVHEASNNENMANINSYNSMLEQLASDGGYTFVDLCTLMKDDTGYFSSAYAEADGLHFLGTAYVAMLNYIKSELG